MSYVTIQELNAMLQPMLEAQRLGLETIKAINAQQNQHAESIQQIFGTAEKMTDLFAAQTTLLEQQGAAIHKLATLLSGGK